MVTLNLVEMKEGLFLLGDSAKKIWSKEKSLIIKDKLFKNQTNKLFYVIDQTLCYGIIKLKNPDKIDIQEFYQLSKQHLISENYRARHWPSKQVLFSYGFDIINSFEVPRKINVSSSNSFMRSFEFVDVEKNSVNDISKYDPSKKDNKELVQDFKIVSSWYNTKRSSGIIVSANIKHSIEDIKLIAQKIMKEIKSRIECGKMSYIKQTQKTMSIEPFEQVECSNEFSSIYKAVEYMFNNGNKFILEKKLDSVRVMLIKDNGIVRIYSDNKADITKMFFDLTIEAGQLSQKDIACDCYLSYKNGTDKLKDYIEGKSDSFEPDLLSLCVFDCVYYGGDISSQPLSERKSIIHSINFTKHISEMQSIFVENKDDAKKGLLLLKTISNMDGAVIKECSSKYKKGTWFNFQSKEVTTTATKGIEKVSGKKEGKELLKQSEQIEDPNYDNWDKKKDI